MPAMTFAQDAEKQVGVAQARIKVAAVVADAKPAKDANEAGAEAAKANRPDENFLRSQRTQRDNVKNQNTGAVDGGEATLEDLVRLSMDGDQLRLEAVGSTGARSQRYRVKGADAVVTVTRSVSSAIAVGNGVVRPPSTSVSLNRFDLNVKDDETIWSTSASQSSTYLSISGQSVLGRVSFSQNNSTRLNAGAIRTQPVRVTVYEWQAGPRQKSVFTAGADSIDKLRAQHPAEFRKYVVPLFRKFSDMSWMTPGASDAYGVFGEITPDPQMAARVQALLPELDSDSFATREAAARQLMELGPAGVLAALRMEPASLSDEQKGQLGRLIAAHRRRYIANPDEARRDPNFLADCLEHPDFAVREAAKLSLEKVLNKPLTFDPKLTGDALQAAADDVRKLVQELTPATQPADQPAAPGAVPVPVPAVIEQRLLIR
ncbi:hypothetical protein [Humisphaera borealis]|nr:hypothetical protein [Humisphaera borealis]